VEREGKTDEERRDGKSAAVRFARGIVCASQTCRSSLTCLAVVLPCDALYRPCNTASPTFPAADGRRYERIRDGCSSTTRRSNVLPSSSQSPASLRAKVFSLAILPSSDPSLSRYRPSQAARLQKHRPPSTNHRAIDFFDPLLSFPPNVHLALLLFLPSYPLAMPSHLSLSTSSKAQVEQLIKDSVNSAKTPPYFFTAVSADGPLVSFNFGKDQDGKDISSDTVIRIHSMTKMVTSVSAKKPLSRPAEGGRERRDGGGGGGFSELVELTFRRPSSDRCSPACRPWAHHS